MILIILCVFEYLGKFQFTVMTTLQDSKRILYKFMNLNEKNLFFSNIAILMICNSFAFVKSDEFISLYLEKKLYSENRGGFINP